MEEMAKKRIIAKLYNLKSYVDGKIQEVNCDLIEPPALSSGISMMTLRLCNEIDPDPASAG